MAEEEKSSGMIVILFTTHVPNTLSDELLRQGYEVYEALAISEASIIITPDVDQTRARVIQQHWPTVRLHNQFTALDVSLN